MPFNEEPPFRPPRKSWFQRFREWLEKHRFWFTAIAAVIGVVALCGGFLLQVAAYIDRMESDAATATAAVIVAETARADRLEAEEAAEEAAESAEIERLANVDVAANYVCATSLDFRNDPYLEPLEFEFSNAIKTPYYQNVSTGQNRHYLFVVVINRGIDINFTDVRNALWVPNPDGQHPEPADWADLNSILGAGTLKTDGMLALLVDDRDVQTIFSEAEGFPANPGTSVVGCGDLANWNFSSIEFVLYYKPQGDYEEMDLSILVDPQNSLGSVTPLREDIPDSEPSVPQP